MDLSKIKAVDSLRVAIRHHDCKGVVFTVAGPTHPATLQAQEEARDKAAKRRTKPSQDEMERALVEALAARVISWEGVEWSGEPMPCTRENVVKVLGCPDLAFIRDQIMAAMGDDDAFFSA